MAVFVPTTHDAIVADPEGHIQSLYSSTRGDVLGLLPASFATLPEYLIKQCWSSILAWDLKPYGPDVGMTLKDALAASSLNCADYCVLTAEIYRIIKAANDLDPSFVGWNGGAVGNHAQLMCGANGNWILLDPTIGYLAHGVTFDGLCRGEAPAAADTSALHATFHPERTNVAAFEATVRDAVANGLYVASSLLYWFPDIDAYRANGVPANWATPQALLI